MSTLPPTVILPPDLDAPILDELLALWLQFAPRDAYERLLVTRIIQATARLHVSARRETDEADPLWLRYESAADRLFRQSLKALEKHRAQHPVPASTQQTEAVAKPSTPPSVAASHGSTPTPSRHPTPNPSHVAQPRSSDRDAPIPVAPLNNVSDRPPPARGAA